MNYKIFFTVIALAAAIIFTSCEKDDPVIPNEEELITTLIYTLTPSGGGETVILSFIDLDGDGGSDPIVEGGNLKVNETYSGTLQLLNEVETPNEDITEEIKEEDEEHQFFFQSSIDDVSIEYSDLDANGNPVGVETVLTTGNSASGTITIILRHEPNKTGTGVSDGDITNAGGETDIEVTLPVNVQ